MHEREPTSEHEFRPPEPARIYVASLSDYNAGRLHGLWIDATRDLDEIAADIARMLNASREPLAEEWAIHDYDGFGHINLNEHDPLERIATIACGIAEHGPAYAAWINHLGDIPDDTTFEECYRGTWPDLAAYAQSYADDIDLDRIISEHTPGYLGAYIHFDAEAFGRDLELGSDIFTVDTPDGDIWVFDTY